MTKISMTFFCILGLVISWYSWKNTNECNFIPVTFDPFNHPQIEAQIAGNFFPIFLDLGSAAQVVLKEEILQKLNPDSYGISIFQDFQNKSYSSENYLIPELTFADVTFFEVIAQKRNSDYDRNVTFPKNTEEIPPEKTGSIGNGLLKRRNLFLDFPHSRMAIVNKSNKTIKGYLEKMLKIPFEMISFGIVLKVETDCGEKKFLLDTGATWSTLKSSLYDSDNEKENWKGVEFFSSKRFVIEGKDFGPVRLCLLDISLENFDGILGMSFLQHHAVYIDFRKKLLYIGNILSE